MESISADSGSASATDRRMSVSPSERARPPLAISRSHKSYRTAAASSVSKPPTASTALRLQKMLRSAGWAGSKAARSSGVSTDAVSSMPSATRRAAPAMKSGSSFLLSTAASIAAAAVGSNTSPASTTTNQSVGMPASPAFNMAPSVVPDWGTQRPPSRGRGGLQPVADASVEAGPDDDGHRVERARLSHEAV